VKEYSGDYLWGEQFAYNTVQLACSIYKNQDKSLWEEKFPSTFLPSPSSEISSLSTVGKIEIIKDLFRLTTIELKEDIIEFIGISPKEKKELSKRDWEKLNEKDLIIYLNHSVNNFKNLLLVRRPFYCSHAWEYFSKLEGVKQLDDEYDLSPTFFAFFLTQIVAFPNGIPPFPDFWDRLSTFIEEESSVDDLDTLKRQWRTFWLSDVSDFLGFFGFINNSFLDYSVEFKNPKYGKLEREPQAILKIVEDLKDGIIEEDSIEITLESVFRLLKEVKQELKEIRNILDIR